MAVTAGSVWVQGDYLHFTPTTTTNYRYLGTYVAYRSTGIAGSIWIDGANLRYLDSANNERYLPLGSASTPGGVTSAINGSVWIENNRLNSVEGSTKQKREYHTDIAFSDTYFSDTPFGNFSHLDETDIGIGFGNYAAFSNNPAHSDSSFGDTVHQDHPEFVGNV